MGGLWPDRGRRVWRDPGQCGCHEDQPGLIVGRILGTTEDTGKLLGLDKEWLARAIKTTGNYGEIF